MQKLTIFHIQILILFVVTKHSLLLLILYQTLPGLLFEKGPKFPLHLVRNALVEAVKSAANQTPSRHVRLFWYLDVVIDTSVVLDYVHFLDFIFSYCFLHYVLIIC